MMEITLKDIKITLLAEQLIRTLEVLVTRRGGCPRTGLRAADNGNVSG